MTTQSVPRYCRHCDLIIEGEAEEFIPDSASGARPTEYYHPTCGPAQTPHNHRNPYAPYGKR
ncbi:hypothetical protein [Streptomyces sp. TRM49041]|uniref:hypothetical protein n=1 Tax=Streptomyces sp. TRM49041 TaxID=2603216 RepID=UPI0011F086A9|nr:hypothetical protein [Streptomyces sp. TRM49041]